MRARPSGLNGEAIPAPSPKLLLDEREPLSAVWKVLIE
jgi:hypothetical protein